MGACRTNWEGTYVEIIEADDTKESIFYLVEQIKATLRGLGYCEETIEEAFK